MASISFCCFRRTRSRSIVPAAPVADRDVSELFAEVKELLPDDA
jgi:hypothetical protein